MSDENILSLSDETKSMMRNYAMVAGFFAVFIVCIINVVCLLGGKTLVETVGTSGDIAIYVIITVMLMISGIVLALLHKRDQVSITFLFMAMVMVFMAFRRIFADIPDEFLGVGIVMLLIGIMMLITKNEQRVICSLMILPAPIFLVIGMCCLGAGMDITTALKVASIGLLITALAALYAVFAIGLENPKFPGYEMFVADENDESKDGVPVHFKISGAILGYMTLTIPMFTAMLYSLHVSGMTQEVCSYMDIFAGLMLAVFGIVMLVAGRMRFTPFLFMILGVSLAIAGLVGANSWIICIIMVILGIICVFKFEERMLLGTALILFGLSWLFADQAIFSTVEAVSIFINLIPAVILTCISFALCSNGKLQIW